MNGIDTPKQAAEQHEKESVGDTVRSMRQHFASTGAYRGEDLIKVFGNPVEGVVATLQTTLASVNVKRS